MCGEHLPCTWLLAICDNALPYDKRLDAPDEGEPQGHKAAGVILAVCARFSGGWTDINKDEDGRFISANIILADDTTARINAVYGVSGACSPNFTSFVHKIWPRLESTIISPSNR